MYNHRTGYGHHADYVFGWEGDSLQRAMDKCGADILGLPDSCPELIQISDEEMNSCKQQPMVDEVVEGQCTLVISPLTLVIFT
jgi:hypothetical protein